MQRAAELPSEADETALSDVTEPSGEDAAPSFWTKARNAIFGGKLDKERIKALGLGAVLSYGFVSNTTYGACIVIAWVTHVKRTGLTPLAPGQWPGFLAVYAGLWAMQNILRPIRFTVAVAMTPFVDRLMTYVQNKLSVSKGKSFALLLISLALFSISYLVFFLWVFGGFPRTVPTAKVA